MQLKPRQAVLPHHYFAHAIAPKMGSNQKRLARLVKSGSGKLVLVGAIAGGGVGLLVGTAGIGLLVGAAAGFIAEKARNK